MGCDVLFGMLVLGLKISIHAPHAGRDDCRKGRIDRILVFQSTRPLRGATLVIPHIGLRRHISIHAPHAGRDFLDL